MSIKEKTEELLPKQEKGLRKTIWWMLQELHQESDVALSESFDFDIRGTDPGPISQRRSIRFLENIGVITIVDTRLSRNSGFHSLALVQNSLGGADIQPVRYKLQVHKDALLEVYEAYESFFGKNIPNYLSFDNKTGSLTYKEKSLKFRPQSQSFTVLDILINNTDSYYTYGDTLDFQEINALATQDGSVEPIAEKAFYNVHKHVNDKATKELGINDFLILREATLGLNSKIFEEQEES